MGTRLQFQSYIRILALCIFFVVLLTTGAPFATSFKSLKSVAGRINVWSTYNRAFLAFRRRPGTDISAYATYRESLLMSTPYNIENHPENWIKSSISSSTSCNVKQKARSSEPSIVISMLNKALLGKYSFEDLDIFRQEIDSMGGRDIAQAMFLSSKSLTSSIILSSFIAFNT